MEQPRDTLGSIGYLTNLAGRLLVRALERRLAGGSAGPMPVFLALNAGKALPQKELARLAAVEQPTMANTLARMERDGLVTGAPDPKDGRSTLLRLTRLGHERADSALTAAGAVNNLALSALKPAERPVFLDMLKRVIATLEADG
jgi:MarR family transcriptional regulator, transcriptional regulator for hemolysin